MKTTIMKKHNVKDFGKLTRVSILNQDETKEPKIAFIGLDNKVEFTMRLDTGYIFIFHTRGSVATVYLSGDLENTEVHATLNQSLYIHMNLNEFIKFINDYKEKGKTTLTNVYDYQGNVSKKIDAYM